jgi:hypothetical protein
MQKFRSIFCAWPEYNRVQKQQALAAGGDSFHGQAASETFVDVWATAAQNLREF